MKKKRGIIYQRVNSGEYCIGYHDEQKPAFSNYQRVFIHFFTDKDCTVPKTDEDGKKTVGLDHVTNLKVIGYTD